ncbi:MAG: 4-(cytidine 5'-diphospho)-2-C-methyl-D-erythritol kinase [Armatimonadota bacterium]
MSLVIQCPAKLNLFLSVGPKDHRGYHPLRSVFQAVSLYDELHIERASELSFECDDPGVPPDNTVIRAARLMMEVADFPSVAIKLIKRIPSEAGLGGGSSDAAGIIRASKSLMSAQLPDYERKAIAKSIGADVSFFLLGGRAKAEGYGEKLTKVDSPNPVEWFVIAQPEDRCNTKDAYNRLDEMDYEWQDFPSDDILYNVFERVAPCGSLDLIERLQVHGAKDAGLTGSGSAVFGRFHNGGDAQCAATKMQAEAPFVAVAHSL